jgi:hypothetical protein
LAIGSTSQKSEILIKVNQKVKAKMNRQMAGEGFMAVEEVSGAADRFSQKQSAAGGGMSFQRAWSFSQMPFRP